MTAFDDLRKKHDALLDAAYSVTQSEVRDLNASIALTRLRSAEIHLDNLVLMATGLRNSLAAVDRQLGDDIQRFKRAGRDDPDTRARDHFRDIVNGLLMIVKEIRKTSNKAGNEIQAATGSLRR